MARARSPERRHVIGLSFAGALATILVLAGCAWIWRGELWRTALDPKQPYPTYRPPPPPDYAKAAAWALRPSDAARPRPGEPAADIFFVHPTTYAGGRDWNAPLDNARAEAVLQRVVLPNYAGPFQRVGRVWAPRYRAASLFAFLTLRDDARDARRFAYRDVRAAFDAMLAQDAPDRPLVIAGVGQGASLALRLLQDRVLHDPAVLKRVAAVYLMNTVVPVDALPPSGPLSACQRRDERACTVAWAATPEDNAPLGERRLARALAWTPDGDLTHLGGRAVVCVNPLTGSADQPTAGSKASRGAANATGLEWGARPAFLPHEVSAACEGGLLRVSRPLAASLQPSGDWAERRMIAGSDLFYADIEADAQARMRSWLGDPSSRDAAPPITTSERIGGASVHRID